MVQRSDEPVVHNRIAVLRTERGMSRRDLAAAIDVHYQTVGYLERGEYNPSLVLALRISELFGLPVEQIFSLEPLPLLSAHLSSSPSPSSPAPPSPSTVRQENAS